MITDFRSLLIPLICLALLLLSGCRGCFESGETFDSSDSNAESQRCEPLSEELSRSSDHWTTKANLFVITALRFGTEHEGLDMDCIETPSACRSEFCREGPDDGRGGVDNRLGPLARKISTVAGSDLEGEMTRAVKSGRHPLLLSLEAESVSHARRISAIELSFGLDADDDPSDLPTGNGVVRQDPDAPSKRPSRFTPAVVRDGLVTAGPTSDWMPLFWTRGQIAAVPVVTSYVQFRITDEGRITDGVMAGAMSPGDLSGAILEMDARTAKVLTRLGPIVRALVRQQADLDLISQGSMDRRCRDDDECFVGQTCRGERCFEPDQHFDSISFAILFEAVTAIESQ